MTAQGPTTDAPPTASNREPKNTVGQDRQEQSDVHWNARRVLHRDDPKGFDYRGAAGEIDEVRRELSTLRHRLQMIYLKGIDRGHMAPDSTCLAAAGAVSCAITALFPLVDGTNERSLIRRGELVDDLWRDVDAHPERYVIEEGRSW